MEDTSDIVWVKNLLTGKLEPMPRDLYEEVMRHLNPNPTLPPSEEGREFMQEDASSLPDIDPIWYE
ncbi:MAG: hypothetical protein NZ765_07775 [Anaerolineae bacterium]|nr:hypothetical protein [Anaerolineae bacterium]MDW8071501.1 hypothetical protein [Anaerolineae bacterium]